MVSWCAYDTNWHLHAAFYRLCHVLHLTDSHTILNSACFILNKFHYSTSSFLDAGNVWFSLNGTTYKNNSLVTLEDIGEDDTALLCMTNLIACCLPPYTNSSALGNWYFPNATRFFSRNWYIYRTRGQMVVYMRRIGGGENGIYRCEIHDSMNVKQNIYIGVYTAGSGEWYCILYTAVLLLPKSETNAMKVKVNIICSTTIRMFQLFSPSLKELTY